ncbi:polyphosphate kinase 2 [Siculibacillus lacustris]|uniref:ADP/GDP-polyphosphate phosphotransferase n=1 Tax=Siculibacillus lacustris TaxID=1549641 RepID=A0A4Q9VTB1_9HYPH|nr:polyphosphate kinase 2 [Siculibacillus lacustris]TBW39287.1 polyphosphate kinase 2 [Siculibacillus lacustris]
MTRDAQTFDLDSPKLPKWVDDNAFSSGGYPHSHAFDEREFADLLVRLQIELVKLQSWAITRGERIVILFEGRDGAGKGSVIGAFRQYMNPRRTRVVALPKPSTSEVGQWYFQRYVAHMPTSGEIVMFDRSWYNRAGVERVMGFCTPEQTEMFLKEAPRFEAMLVGEGLKLIKFYIEVGREMQLARFWERRHNPLKTWKISDIDTAAVDRFDDYGRARDRMLETTHTDAAPWTVVLGNDKRRLKLNAIRHVLQLFDYEGKDRKVIGEIDAKVLGHGPGFLVNGKH